MSETKVIEKLVEIKAVLESNGKTQDRIATILENDRKNMWKLLTLVIVGAFALIGIRLVLPS